MRAPTVAKAFFFVVILLPILSFIPQVFYSRRIFEQVVEIAPPPCNITYVYVINTTEVVVEVEKTIYLPSPLVTTQPNEECKFSGCEKGFQVKLNGNLRIYC
jgi:hypothetical protein